MTVAVARHPASAGPFWRRAWEDRTVLSLLCLAPAILLLLVFLTYPLGLGVWLGFTDARIGRPGVIYDSQFSIISWALTRLGLIDHYIAFLGQPGMARASVIAANIWRGIPFVAICLLAGLQTISPSLYEAASLDGAAAWQRFRYVTLPLLMPVLSIVLTFSILFTFTDFQLIYAITRGGPSDATHLMATLAFQRAIGGGNPRQRASLLVAI